MAGRLQDVILRNSRANQPAATTVAAGTLYYVTDEFVTERSTGAAWQDVSDTAIANDSVTYAKMQNVSAASRILGRGSAGGAGDTEELTVSGQGIVIDATTVKVKKVVGLVIDGGGSAISTGVKGYIRVPWTGTITKNTVLADQSGSIVIDVWKDTYANYPPTDADSITAAAPPTLSGATKSEDATLTGWTTSITAGDVLGFNVDSAATVTRVTLELEVTV